MRIDGKEIAQEMYSSLHISIIPHLVVILIGDNTNSISYIKQKQRAAEHIGAQVKLIQLPEETTEKQVIQTIQQYNIDSSVHAILVQKPLPQHIDSKKIDVAIIPNKDIDGFNPKSKFVLALPLAVARILEEVYQDTQKENGNSFLSWLKTKNIVVLGKGDTAGKPTITYLQKLGISPILIDSKTENKEDLLRQADIIISAVGKPNVLRAEQIKKGVILIGVGMHREDDGKLHGDYNEEQIMNIASFYTPTPGGVGPVNVACLMSNLVKATSN